MPLQDICPKCGGTGRTINSLRPQRCVDCVGSGRVSQGKGIPSGSFTVAGFKLPDISLPDIPIPDIEIPEISLPGTGYDSNKRKLKEEVEEGGWTPIWADDITEMDAANGVISIGISIYTGSPAAFVAWVKELVQRTIKSLEKSASSITSGIADKIQVVAQDAIRGAIQGKKFYEIVDQFGNVDVKAGAIRYSGENYVGNYVISKTWGMKPFVALRWQTGSSPQPTPGASTPNHTAPGFTPILDNSTKTYAITFQTGKRFGAGTDADVFITVIGTQGSITAHELDNAGNDRESGSIDTYNVDRRNLGDITGIIVWHNNIGVGPGWFLEQVRIEDLTDKKTWFFNCQCWLAVSEGDGKIRRVLTPTGVVG